MSQATEQAFIDLSIVTGKINRINADIKEVAHNIEQLEGLKIAILDDSKRAAELKKILDIHPKHTKVKFANAIKKLSDLKDYLATNGYL